MSRFDRWAADNTGAWRDMDGYYGAQCWDLFSAYCVDLMGAQVWQTNTAPSGTWAGLAGSLFAQYPVTPWQGQNFDRISASQPGLKGDVVIWNGDAYHPVTHVAILLADVQPGASLYVLAQNAGMTMNARRMWETPTTYGYLRPKDRSFITTEGEEVVTQQDINAIANAVWNFKQNGVLMRDRVQGTDQAANGINNKVGEKVWSYLIQGVQARDRLYGLDKIQVPGLSRQVAQLTAQVAAQQAAIDAMAKSLGADPTSIAKTVEQAVKAKLESLQITVTDKD